LILAGANDKTPSFSPPVDGDVIPKGQRHRAMVSFAGSMRTRGLSPDAILVSLRILNEQHCKPPLENADLERIAKDIGRKPAGFRGSQSVETCSEIEIESFVAVPIEKIRWLWTARIASGKLNLFVGDPEKGKSLVSIDVTARVSTGRDFPDGAPCEPGDVLIISCEDDASDTVAPRLLEAGAHLARVHRITGVKVVLGDGQCGQSLFNLERDMGKLQEALEKFPDIKLIVIDPVAAYIGKVDTHVDAAVRAVLGPLAELAAKRKIAIVGEMELQQTKARLENARPGSLKIRMHETRRFVEAELGNLEALLNTEARRARAELAKHIGKIVLRPEGKKYVAIGNWNLFGAGASYDGAGGQNCSLEATIRFTAELAA